MSSIRFSWNRDQSRFLLPSEPVSPDFFYSPYHEFVWLSIQNFRKFLENLVFFSWLLLPEISKFIGTGISWKLICNSLCFSSFQSSFWKLIKSHLKSYRSKKNNLVNTFRLKSRLNRRHFEIIALITLWVFTKFIALINWIL